MVWALMHAACYLLEHYLGLTRVFSKLFSAKAFLFFKWVLFLSWLNLTWAVFRSDRVIDALNHLDGISFEWDTLSLLSHATLCYWIVVLLIALLIDHGGIADSVINGAHNNKLALLREIVFLDIWLVSLFFLGGIGSTQVLYFNF